MDLVEMVHPYLAIITVSLDRNIRCFKNYKLYWKLNENISLKQLDYTAENGAALLVTGFQASFTVWDI